MLSTNPSSSDVGQQDGSLRSVGFALAAATAAAHLALAAVSLRRGCRRYGDLLHGLCLHAALVGCLQGGLVAVLHALLQSTTSRHDQPVWRVVCKLYLFCRIFLPGLFLYLMAAITVCFRSVRYPPRRCGRSCTRLGYLTAHCLPWVACSAGLLPVLLMHKDGTEVALRNQGRCLLIERWTWLGPLAILMGAPLLAELTLTCLLCAYKPYRSAKEDDDDDDFDEEDYDYFDEFGGSNGGAELDCDDNGNDTVLGADERQPPRRPSRRGQDRRPGNGFRSVQPPSSEPPTAPSPVGCSPGGRRVGRYYSDSRLLRGRPMRLARSLLLTISLLQACTQLPHCITAVLQTVLRNLHSRQLIQQSAIDTLYWLHLSYFPLAGLLLTAFVLQLHRAFRITEAEIEKELQACCRTRAAVREVLQTTSMLTSL